MELKKQRIKMVEELLYKIKLYMSEVKLYDVLKNSYSNKKKQMDSLKKNGYNYDSMLSNHNQQVYYNPSDRKLIVNVSGTHNWHDVGTDAYLAAGKLKDTNRYKEADLTFKEAKLKYKPIKTNVIGNSLGGTIAGYIAGKNDKVITHNKGATIGQKMRANETHYRINGDLVSLLNANSKHTVNLSNPNILKDPFHAHLVNTLKDKKIRV
jgi:hypothetical protein